MPPEVRRRHLLAWFAHPDDETWSAAGLLCHAARDGFRVTVVCATRGERGIDRRDHRDETDLGAIRTAELARACAILGAETPIFVDLPDGAVDASCPASQARLESLLGELGPDVVVTLGPDGGYGHRDHLACTALLDTARARLAPSERPRVLHAVFPRGLFAPVHRALGQQRPSCIDASVREADLGVTADQVDLRFSLDALGPTKARALAAHASQLPGGDPQFFLHPGLIDPLLREEWFVVASGRPWTPGATDLLED